MGTLDVTRNGLIGSLEEYLSEVLKPALKCIPHWGELDKSPSGKTLSRAFIESVDTFTGSLHGLYQIPPVFTAMIIVIIIIIIISIIIVVIVIMCTRVQVPEWQLAGLPRWQSTESDGRPVTPTPAVVFVVNAGHPGDTSCDTGWLFIYLQSRPPDEGTPYAKNPLDTFPRNFPVDGEVAKLLRTCCRLLDGKLSWHVKMSSTSWQQVVGMEFGKRHDTTDTTMDFCPRQLVRGLLRTCYGDRGNWCNGCYVGLYRTSSRPRLPSPRSVFEKTCATSHKT